MWHQGVGIAACYLCIGLNLVVIFGSIIAAVPQSYRRSSHSVQILWCVFVFKEEGGSGDLRGDGNLGPCLLLNLLQVAALLPNQPAHEAVVGEDFERDVLRPTNTHPHTFRLGKVIEDKFC